MQSTSRMFVDFNNADPWEKHAAASSHDLTHPACVLALPRSIERFNEFQQSNLAYADLVRNGVNAEVYNNATGQPNFTMAFDAAKAESFNMTDDVALATLLPNTPALLRYHTDGPPIQPRLTSENFEMHHATDACAQGLNMLADTIDTARPF